MNEITTPENFNEMQKVIRGENTIWANMNEDILFCKEDFKYLTISEQINLFLLSFKIRTRKEKAETRQIMKILEYALKLEPKALDAFLLQVEALAKAEEKSTSVEEDATHTGL